MWFEVLPDMLPALPGAPRLVISDPRYSEGRQDGPPMVWNSPEIDSSKFTLHILSDTSRGSQWLKYILLMICRNRSISSHSFRSWIRICKSNRKITTVSTSKIVMPIWLSLHLSSRGYEYWTAFCIKPRNRPNTLISTTIAPCWHLWRMGMHLGTMQRSRCHGSSAWHTSVWWLWRSCGKSLPMLCRWLPSAIASTASSAISLESPLLRIQLPMPLSLCIPHTWTYAVPWKWPLEVIDICCSSSMTPQGIQLSSYWSSSVQPLRNSKNERLLEK